MGFLLSMFESCDFCFPCFESLYGLCSAKQERLVVKLSETFSHMDCLEILAEAGI